MRFGLILVASTIAGLALLALAGGAMSARAAFPGEPGLIAFVLDTTDGIFLMSPTGAPQRRLTPRRETQRDPAWSPGGRWIMYTANGIWVARPDGSRRRRIARFGSDGAWSPDGRRVIFVGRHTKIHCTDVFSMRLNGADLRRHTFTRACERDPSYSPDGESILFIASTEYASHIVVKNSRSEWTGGRTVIGEGHSPDWSPDGRSIAFAFGSEIRVVDPTGLLVHRLDLADRVAGRFDVRDVSWSPAGDEFVFAQVQGGPTSVGISRGGARIYRVRIDGTALRELTVTAIDSDTQPAWQPVRR
jgi:Tol biopolymer transport system component